MRQVARKNFDDRPKWSCFDTILDRDRRTDGRTDTATAALMRSTHTSHRHMFTDRWWALCRVEQTGENAEQEPVLQFHCHCQHNTHESI